MGLALTSWDFVKECIKSHSSHYPMLTIIASDYGSKPIEIILIRLYNISCQEQLLQGKDDPIAAAAACGVPLRSYLTTSQPKPQRIDYFPPP